MLFRSALYLDTSLTTFVGLVDAVQTPDLSALAYADYRQGLALCLSGLPRLVEEPGDGATRIQLVMAAVLANRGSQSTFNTRGRSRTTGVDRILRYQYPEIGQGASNAVLLPAMLRINRDLVPEEQARLAALLGAEDPADYLDRFLNGLGVATRLRDLGVPRDDLPRLARLDAEAPAFGQGANRISDAGELTRLLETAW